ncbi:VanZ family protein [Sporolactobacillus shoreicorticis]|uniref:VanZ family protein n=1 Tax=Sporolactobacillus shoreicorticis TaxID=1923877 RepID=A0ABW5RZV8_9BACL|nr:VanZ family protein [Sporolactobacillus shoreicorticis]MCO7126991.1 VanZ family protein [Sporolactobacillus shoreicorticis]
MDKKFAVYISEIISELDCDETEKKDLQEEMGQHLQLLKEEYMGKGLSEKEAVDTAIRCFGRGNELKKGLNHSFSPYKKSFLVFVRVMFVFYVSTILWIVIVRKIIDRLLHNQFYNSFVWAPNNYFFYSTTNFIPFKTISSYLNSEYISMFQAAELLLSNSILFVPLGIFLPIVFKRYRSLLQVIKITLIVGAAIEILQFFFRYGIMDIDEIILYMIGSVTGYAFFVSLKGLNRKWFRMHA